MPDIAKAYVQIIPSAEGIKKGIEKQMGGAGESGGNAFNKAFKKMLGGAAVTAAVAVITKGIISISKQAVSAYADYEQMVGGVETLFGTGGRSLSEYAADMGTSIAETAGQYRALESAQNTVLANADGAYKTAGLSANDYMETVTSFAASLKQSFDDSPEGIRAFAAAADQAVIDMSDNANKMGTDMTSIQDAYQGFAKQNYTMLDNLKLGYGGTKTEMQRLLSDAQELTGVEYNIDNLSDVYAAIHAIQTDLGITGTTADEASTTISGSLSALQASWTNVLTTLGGGGELDIAIQNLTASAGTFLQNLTPVIVNIINGLIAALPGVFSAAVNAIITYGPEILAAAMNAFANIIIGIGEALAPIVETVANGIVSGVEAIGGFVGDMINAGKDLVQGLINGIKAKLGEALAAIAEIGSQIVAKAKQFLQIGSPSKVFYDIGGFVSEGMANGIASGAGLVTDATDRMVKGTMQGLGAISSIDGAMASGMRGMSQINIYAQQLSQADIDYVVATANRRLGASLA